MKTVLMSTRPVYCEWIETGDKNVEVRKTRPNTNTPFKVLLYCTKVGNLLYKSNNNNMVFLTHKKYRNSILRNNHIELNGKVIGEFICNQINEYTEEKLFEGMDEINASFAEEYSCLSIDELLAYKGKNNVLYFWHISDLVIYDKPKELSEFKTFCKSYYDGDKCDDCKFFINGDCYEHDESDCGCNGLKPIERPPQSWCYVEEG